MEPLRDTASFLDGSLRMHPSVTKVIASPRPADIEVVGTTAIVPAIMTVCVQTTTFIADNYLYVDDQLVGQPVVCIVAEVTRLAGPVNLGSMSESSHRSVSWNLPIPRRFICTPCYLHCGLANDSPHPAQEC